jgi:hypothetical protein
MANRDVILSLSKDPLTSILSLGGERKIREWGFLRGDGGGFDTIIFIQFITRY